MKKALGYGCKNLLLQNYTKGGILNARAASTLTKLQNGKQ